MPLGMVEARRKKVSRNWIKIQGEELPPLDSSVMVKVVLGRDKHTSTYIGKFFNDNGSISVSLGQGWPIPQRAWETEGVKFWMPLPN